MKLLKRILYYFVVTILVVYILFMLVSPEKMMELAGFRTFIVLTDSMEPEINKNDLIIATRPIESELEVGDIITFSVYIPGIDQEAFVTHYIGDIVEKDGETIYKTRGIDLPLDQYDGWVDKDRNPIDITLDNIEGEYIFKIPYVGYIQSIYNNKLLLGLIVFNGAVLYIAFNLLKKEKNKRNQPTS